MTQVTVQSQAIVERLRQKLDGTSSSRLAKTDASKSGNFLQAITLNAFARKKSRSNLTDLEQKLVDIFLNAGFTDSDLEAIGEVYATAPQSGRSALFSERFATLNGETGYSSADLKADMPQLAADTLKNPNMRLRLTGWDGLASIVKDPEKYQALINQLPDQNLSPEDIQKLCDKLEYIPEGEPEPNLGVICYGVPIDSTSSSPDQAKSYSRIRLWADKVYCEKGTHEVGNDEPYFGFALTDDVNSQSYKSEVLSMDEEDWRTFNSNILWDNSINSGGLWVVVDAWEQDNSDQYQQISSILSQVLNYLHQELFPQSWDQLASAFIGGVTGTGIPTEILLISYTAISLIKSLLTNPNDHLNTYSLVIPDNEFAIMRGMKSIADSEPNLAAAASKISATYGIDYTTAMIHSMLGFYKNPTFIIPMDNDDENHGIYSLYIRLQFL